MASRYDEIVAQTALKIGAGETTVKKAFDELVRARELGMEQFRSFLMDVNRRLIETGEAL